MRRQTETCGKPPTTPVAGWYDRRRHLGGAPCSTFGGGSSLNAAIPESRFGRASLQITGSVRKRGAHTVMKMLRPALCVLNNLLSNRMICSGHSWAHRTTGNGLC
jgi:hypothetical protein